MSVIPERTTASDPNVGLCTLGGVGHDYRPHEYEMHNRPHTSLRCVWCHVLSCGDFSDPDPCLEPIHHKSGHRTGRGVTWAIGDRRRGPIA